MLLRRNAPAGVLSLLTICLLLLLAGLAPAADQAQAPAPAPVSDQAALDDGLAWLKLIDKGDYAASWQEAAPNFQKAMDQDRWVKTLGAVRQPLGKVISRTLDKQKLRHQMPGAPDGEYCLLLFDSVFKDKKEATELVTLQKVDGKWRSVGYFIR